MTSPNLRRLGGSARRRASTSGRPTAGDGGAGRRLRFAWLLDPDGPAGDVTAPADHAALLPLLVPVPLLALLVLLLELLAPLRGLDAARGARDPDHREQGLAEFVARLRLLAHSRHRAHRDWDDLFHQVSQLVERLRHDRILRLADLVVAERPVREHLPRNGPHRVDLALEGCGRVGRQPVDVLEVAR